jgi:adenine-specific DNA-methyltransferase
MKATVFQLDFRETLKRVTDADLVFTSPPYDNARTYGNDVAFTFEDYQSLGDHVFQALKPGGHFLLNLDGPVEDRRGLGSERSMTPFRVMLDYADRLGFRFVERLAYVREAAPGAYGGRFRNDWEPLFWFQRPGGEGFFDKEPLKIETKSAPWKRIVHSRKRDGTFYSRKSEGDGKWKHRGTVWDYGNVGNGQTGSRLIESAKHPARFPYYLASDVVQCFSPPEGLVCDPFLGGGTTLIAALDHKRHFIGGDAFGNTEGVPWVRVAEGIAQQRYDTGGLDLFGVPFPHEIDVVIP